MPDGWSDDIIIIVTLSSTILISRLTSESETRGWNMAEILAAHFPDELKDFPVFRLGFRLSREGSLGVEPADCFCFWASYSV